MTLSVVTLVWGILLRVVVKAFLGMLVRLFRLKSVWDVVLIVAYVDLLRISAASLAVRVCRVDCVRGCLRSLVIRELILL